MVKDNDALDAGSTKDQQDVFSDEQVNTLFEKLIQLQERVSATTEPSMDQQWNEAVDKMLINGRPSAWVRDANVQNLADGGQSLEMNIHILDSAWMSFLIEMAHSVLLHHRYEVEFFEKGAMRGKIAVTFTFAFEISDLDWDIDDLENGIGVSFDMFDKTELYRHSWPQLRKFVERTVDDFDWSPVEFPVERVATPLPLATGEVQGLHY